MKIAVCAPTFGRPPEFEHPTPIYQVAKELGGMTPFMGGCSPHDRSRGVIQARAMQTDADAFLWVDDDIRATAAQCRELARSFELELGCQTMTGVYVCRHAAANGLAALNFNALPPSTPEDLEIQFGVAGGVYRVTSHGFGFCIVSRACLERMAVPACEYEPGVPAKAWWLPEVVNGIHLGEDRSFTYRVLGSQWSEPEPKKPWKMLVDTRVCVVHAGWRVT